MTPELKRLLRNFLFWLTFLALTFGAASYFTLNWVMNRLIHSQPIVELPDFRNISFNQAVEMAAEKGFEILKVAEVADPRMPPGSIIQQVPRPGMLVRAGKKIRVIVSQGGKTLYVPDTLGRDLRAAEIVIRNSGFSLGEVSRVYSEDAPKDRVIAQNPDPGSVAGRSALIGVVVSDGEPPAGVHLVPDFTGKKLKDVKRWAQSIDGTVIVKPADQTNENDRRVAKQTPYGGAPSRDGQTIRVFLQEEGKADPSYPIVHFVVPGNLGDPVQPIRMTRAEGGGREKEFYDGKEIPGVVLNLPLPRKFKGTVRIYLGDVLVDQQTY